MVKNPAGLGAQTRVLKKIDKSKDPATSRPIARDHACELARPKRRALRRLSSPASAQTARCCAVQTCRSAADQRHTARPRRREETGRCSHDPPLSASLLGGQRAPSLPVPSNRRRSGESDRTTARRKRGHSAARWRPCEANSAPRKSVQVKTSLASQSLWHAHAM